MNRNKPLSDEEFKNIYSKVTRLVIGLVIKNEKGVLLTLRQKNGWIGQWHIPGGTVLCRESLENAIKRIAHEELHVNVAVGKLLGYVEYFSELQERGFGYTVGLVFQINPESYDFKLDSDAEKVDFFKILPEKMIQEEKDFLLKLE